MLGEWHTKPEIRYDLIRKWEYFLKDAMSYRPVDRTQVKTRDIILADGHAYDEFQDPFMQIARHLWLDIQNYELKSGNTVEDFSLLNGAIPKMQ